MDEYEVPDSARNGPPVERAKVAGEVMDAAARLSSEASRLRRIAIEELVADGWKRVDIARELGLNPSWVSRILSSGVAPERAVLSTDGRPVTVAMGSKTAQVGDGNPADMISSHAAAAFDTIRSAGEAHDIQVEREIVPAPGLVDVNRTNLIVMGSPKVLPLIGQLVVSDPNIAWSDDEKGRFLVDASVGELRSPQDFGESADTAYIGRLSRPDGHGHFLYLAGIHAAGTHGAAVHLVRHLDEIHREAKDKLFSMAIRAEYDGNTITGTEQVTPLYVR